VLRVEAKRALREVAALRAFREKSRETVRQVGPPGAGDAEGETDDRMPGDSSDDLLAVIVIPYPGSRQGAGRHGCRRFEWRGADMYLHPRVPLEGGHQG